MELRKYLPLFGLLFVVYLYGIGYLPLRNEEANRLLTSYELFYFGDPFNLTHLGEPYYLKPPLFMWVVALLSAVLGWAQESARLISIFSVFLSSLVVYRFYGELFGRGKGAFIAALVFLTFGDLALFYGFLAEIDAFLTFLFLLSVYISFKLLKEGRETVAYLAVGIFTALLFLTKGIPAFYHLPISFLILLFFFGKLRGLLSFRPFVGLVGLTLPLGVWYLNLKNPQTYLLALWEQTFMRTPVAQSGGLLKHLLLFPLLNFKQLLPHSAVALFRFFKGKMPASREIFLLLALTFANYLPYLVSPGARGRYILPIFPFLALLLGKLFENFDALFEGGRISKTLYWFSFFVFLLGVGLAIWNLPFFENYGLFSLIGVGFLLLLTFHLYRKKVELFTATLLLVAVLKFGYINYTAPFFEKSHPERSVAAYFASLLPEGAKIRYLPERIDMSLCAYLDIYTEGIVLKKEGDYFLTRKGELPPKPYKVLAEREGWVLGIFAKAP